MNILVNYAINTLILYDIQYGNDKPPINIGNFTKVAEVIMEKVTGKKYDFNINS